VTALDSSKFYYLLHEGHEALLVEDYGFLELFDMLDCCIGILKFQGVVHAIVRVQVLCLQDHLSAFQGVQAHSKRIALT
jgi:hypothetical protein